MRKPYVHPNLHANQSIVWPGGNILRIPHPETNPDLPINATATSGLPVSYITSDPSMARVDISEDGVILVALRQQGICQVTAIQPGTSYWNPASLTKTLYIGTTPPPPIGIEDVEKQELVCYPNPTTGIVTLQIQNSDFEIQNCYLTDLTGRREQVRLTAEGSGRYTLDLTSRPQATYLLTLTTASGKTHTIRLTKMSDIFSQ
jgi:hypothetical protein